MRTIIPVAIACLLLITACDTAVKGDMMAKFPTDDINVEANEHNKYNYKDKTYFWSGSLALLNDPEGKWVPPSFDAELIIESTIRNQLSKQGLSQGTSSANLSVAYGIGIDMAALNLKSYADIKAEGLKKVPSGALVIVIAEKRTQKVLWVAAAQAEYKNLAPEVAKNRIQYAIKEIFKRFPG